MSGPSRLLHLLLRADEREPIVGDLEEGYARRIERMGRTRARWWLWRQVLAIPVRLRAADLADGFRHRGTGAGDGALRTFVRDVRFSIRGLLRRPVFFLAAVLTLSVGVGMTTAMFTLLDEAVLRPLPGRDARGLVYLELATKDGQLTMSPTPQLLRLIREHCSAFSRVEGYATENVTAQLDGGPIRAHAAQASDGFFSFLGVRPALGRLFLPGDGSGDASPVVVLGHTFWQDRFGGSRNVLGRDLVIDDRSYEIVGVLPRDFQVDTRAQVDLWTPDGAAGASLAGDAPLEGALARLADGVTLERARAELDAVVAHNPLTRRADRTWVGRIRTPADLVDPKLKQALLLLQAGALLVLLIACGNVANLLLAHGETRAREFAVRASLGADRGRIIRQLLTECGVLGVAGAACGLLLAVWALDVLPLFLPPGFAGFSLHARGLAVSLGVSMAGVLLAGMSPALRGSRRDVGEVLKGSGRGHRRHVLDARRLLVSGQVAMAFVLLFSAALLYESFSGLLASDVGFRRQDLLALRLQLPEETYPDAEAQRTFVERLREALHEEVPGQVASTTVATGLVKGLSVAVAPLASESDPGGDGGQAFLLTWGVAPDYFRVVGLPLLEGRGFTETDGAEGEKVVIINEGVARRVFGGGDPVGRFLSVRGERLRIVGVSGTVRLPALAGSVVGDLQLFLPLGQDAGDDLTVLARVHGDRGVAVERLQAAVRSVDPLLPFRSVELVDDALAASLTRERSNALLAVLFAATALLLGAVGIYGVVAYSVSRQRREIGIRVALGATGSGEVARLVTSNMATVGLGLAVGIAGAAALGPALSGFLHQVGTRDPWVAVGTGTMVTAVALMATWIPARRAAEAHPSEALRAE